MKLTLNIGGEPNTFFSRGVTMGASLRAYELLEEQDRRLEEKTLYKQDHIEKLVEWMLDTFDHKFTLEQLMDGCEESFFVLIPKMLNAVVSGTNAALASFPNG